MKRKSLNEIRKLFLDFFEKKDHLVVPSYPLIPQNDKSLLLINAGMAPLKPYFSGMEVPPRKRMATCQKCIRTGDIENVGRTARHATFFEMLGNFSFGDYFKEESILWGWEFVTKYLEMPVNQLWASIYEEDDEAFEIWHKKIGLPKERIVRLGKEDNFWEIGLGPCGPCSEIYYDRGEKYGCGHEDCKPGCDCDRYVEFWNHVFTQFDKDEEGNYNPLPNPNIDTGMGLERVACIMQGVDSIFEVDTMKYILDGVCKITGTRYNENSNTDVSIRIITDHIRSVTFMVSDGILPSNEGRGYVLRRLLRRAARHGKLLGMDQSFIYQLVDYVTEMYGETYGELKEKKEYIKKVIQVEEERFQETIHQGMDILNEYIEDLMKSGEKVLSGEHAFKLYDTYGFPFDLTREILEEKELEVDETAFHKEMEKQRERARQARSDADTEGWKEDIFSTLDKEIQTQFIGYDLLEVTGRVIAIAQDHDLVREISQGHEAIVILDQTPFYGEGGGQVGDKGIFYNDRVKGTVLDTKKGANNRIQHIVRVDEGVLRLDDPLQMIVNREIRQNTARNHTATHLLHKVLKEEVGKHVQQAGSLVTPERLRFDFTHFEGLTHEQIQQIEEKVNKKIMSALDVQAIETSLKEAKEMGAEALFGEKYGEVVRVINIGDYSAELCGGTHVKNSSEIGMFLILSEGGVAAGIRRIEAVTGIEAYKYIKKREEILNQARDVLKTQGHNLVSRLENLVSELKEKDREIIKLKSQLASSAIEDIFNSAELIGESQLIIHNVGIMSMNDLRDMGDKLKGRLESGIIVLGSEDKEKANFIVMITKDLISKEIHAGNLVKEAAKVAGGGGGGRPDMAQAGGKNPEKINDALKLVGEMVKKQING